MTASELLGYIRENVPNFGDPKLLSGGAAFHYTNHADEIETSGKFLGAPPDENLDFRQHDVPSPKAACEPGVIFAYQNLAEAAGEAVAGDNYGRNVLRRSFPDSEIFKIEFIAAVSAIQKQESELGAPPTIMILTSEVVRFERIGPARNFC